MFTNRTRSFRTALLAPCVLFFALPAHAQTTDEDMCRNGLFPSQSEFHLATVAASATRLYFFDDWNGCPQKGASCQTKAYVVPGDHLLLGKTHGDWSCAWYEGKTHETVGWVRNRDLVMQANGEAAQTDFSGKWKQYNYPGYVSVTRKGDVWYVLGQAYWSSDVATHFGELEGELKTRGSRAHVGATMGDADNCGADLTRIGDFLIVYDNARCGGVNVRFNGVYTRARVTSATRGAGSTGKARSR
jgi:hypothetical protein